MENKIQAVAYWLEKQVMDSSITDGKIWQNLAMSERTFYRFKPKAMVLLYKRSTERQKQIEVMQSQKTKEAVETGLKSKLERVLILQTEVDACLTDLYGSELSIIEKVRLRQVIKELQSEISKIEGDYAPNKLEHAGIIQPPFSDEQVDRILEKLHENKVDKVEDKIQFP